MASRAKIKNLDRLYRKFKTMPADTVAKARVALQQSAEEIVEMARRFVPVRTGKLRDSIGWTFGDEIPEGSVRLGFVKSGISDLTVTIYAGSKEAFYVRFIEFGTAKRRAQPFFLPAYRANKKAAKARIKRAVNASVKRRKAS